MALIADDVGAPDLEHGHQSQPYKEVAGTPVSPASGTDPAKFGFLGDVPGEFLTVPDTLEHLSVKQAMGYTICSNVPEIWDGGQIPPGFLSLGPVGKPAPQE